MPTFDFIPQHRVGAVKYTQQSCVSCEICAANYTIENEIILRS
jgi:hypothetical protein